MADYKYPQFLTMTEGIEFDDIHSPGEGAPFSGVYRCESCGTSVVCSSGKLLPGGIFHPSHEAGTPILWRLVVRTHLK